MQSVCVIMIVGLVTFSVLKEWRTFQLRLVQKLLVSLSFAIRQNAISVSLLVLIFVF